MRKTVGSSPFGVGSVTSVLSTRVRAQVGKYDEIRAMTVMQFVKRQTDKVPLPHSASCSTVISFF